MGPSDEDPVTPSVPGTVQFPSVDSGWTPWRSPNEYRQFVFWVRDSVAARKLGKVNAGPGWQ